MGSSSQLGDPVGTSDSSGFYMGAAGTMSAIRASAASFFAAVTASSDKLDVGCSRKRRRRKTMERRR